MGREWADDQFLSSAFRQCSKVGLGSFLNVFFARECHARLNILLSKITGDTIASRFNNSGVIHELECDQFANIDLKRVFCFG